MPKVATRVLTALAVAPNRSTLTEVLDDAASRHRRDDDPDHDGPERCDLCADLDRLRKEVAWLVRGDRVPADAADYRSWLSEVARYSFHSARLRDLLADAL